MGEAGGAAGLVGRFSLCAAALLPADVSPGGTVQPVLWNGTLANTSKSIQV